MTITRAQVADLQPGDIVELDGWEYFGVVLRGPIREVAAGLVVGPHWVRHQNGEPPRPLRSDATLTVVSRAPSPMYVNHDRSEPVAGDVVRNDEDPDDRRTWMFRANTDGPEWTTHVGRDGPSNVVETHQRRTNLPRSLRLLVDGETGQVVQ